MTLVEIDGSDSEDYKDYEDFFESDEDDYDSEYDDNSEKKYIIDIDFYKYKNPIFLLRRKTIRFSSEEKMKNEIINNFDEMTGYSYNNFIGFELDSFLKEKQYKNVHIPIEIKLTILP